MIEIVSSVFFLVGAAFVVIAALGILRMPDLLTRMQAATKAGTVGAGFLLVGVAVCAATSATAVGAILVAAFLLMTAPVASHCVARAAYRKGIQLTEWTRLDELRIAL